MITYERWSSHEAADQTESHVRDHLASIADEDDDPTTRAEDVQTIRLEQDGGVLIRGRLDAEPVAPYLRDDYDPDVDTEFDDRPCCEGCGR